MTRSAFDYFIRLPLPARHLSPDWLGQRFLRTLDGLTRIDPSIFAGWQVGELRKMKGIPLAAARPRISEIIGRNAHPDDSGRPEPEHGYAALALTTADEESRQMSLLVHSVGMLPEGNVRLMAGDLMVPPDPAIVSYSVFRAALLTMNEIWLPPWGCARVFKLDYDKVPLFPGAALFPHSEFHIPWIAYLGPSLLHGFAGAPDIKTERTPDGGVLMSAIEDRLDPTNPEHLRRARILADILIKATANSDRSKR
jgi:hypothetical protein